ncbi:hypothetical protein SAMN05216588_109194 [Pseudomonas flavescens]|uniref:Uncharacterized protein n=1 Tax=Phytopseudomonas flavescens TaxID=29435 RepID=A0A1G8GUJ3_9GAMM|nr:hypothetical protein [Pseudomonas flavescens]SDH97993.1 hypothetical protein SAMN05216588_109194 [Pseudomonas flavescens]
MKFTILAVMLLVSSLKSQASSNATCHTSSDGSMFFRWNSLILKLWPDELSEEQFNTVSSEEFGCINKPIENYRFSPRSDFWFPNFKNKVQMIEFFDKSTSQNDPANDVQGIKKRIFDRQCSSQNAQIRKLFGEAIEICDLRNNGSIHSRRYKFDSYQSQGRAHEVYCRTSSSGTESCEVQYRIMPSLIVRYEFYSNNVAFENYVNLDRDLRRQFSNRVVTGRQSE